VSFGAHRDPYTEAGEKRTDGSASGWKGLTLGQPVVHFEIIGTDPAKLRSYYGELFGWEFQVGDATTEAVSQPGNHGFVDANTNGGGINGGVAGGKGYERRVLFYVGVANVEAALKRAESLGGKRQMGPEGTPGTLVVGQFTDPEGNLIGVAGTE
jgi:predicted enzyme related to lactoylglutathione lyase